MYYVHVIKISAQICNLNWALLNSESTIMLPNYSYITTSIKYFILTYDVECV